LVVMMAGLPWFELDTDFADNPKIRALAVRLREPLADAYVARLYAYCYRHARDRFDAEVASDTVEDAVRWRGRRGTLFEALFRADILERDAGRVIVHGVKDRLGPHLSKRLGDAERQRRRRDRVAESIGRSGDVTHDVTRESRGNKDKDKDKNLEEAEEASASASPRGPDTLAGRDRKKPQKPPDPRHAPLLARLVDVYAEQRQGQKYAVGARDPRALQRLLGYGSDAEIEQRWRRALALNGRWPGCSSVAQLAWRWNDFATDGVPVNRDAPQRVTAAASPASSFAKGGPVAL